MADNLAIVKEHLDTAIDPAADPGQILAQEHNDVFTEMLSKVGKYTGGSFTVKGGAATVMLPGQIYILAALVAADVILVMSQTTNDGNYTSNILSNCNRGDVLHLKDYNGRSSYLKISEITEGVDTVETPTFVVSTKPMPGNQNYTYQVSDALICIVEVIKGQDFDALLSKIDLRLTWAKYDGKIEDPVGEDFDTYFKNVMFTGILPGGITTPGVVKVKQPIIKTKNYDLIADYSPKVIIERYSPQKYKGKELDTNLRNFQNAGYKRDIVNAFGRPSEFDLTSENFIQDLFAEYYFQVESFPIPRGIGRRNFSGFDNPSGLRENLKGYVYLRFKIQITVDGVDYISEPKCPFKIVGIATDTFKLISYALNI